MKLDRFINRPVLSTVISILIVILGAIGLATLPITQYPDIAPPTVSVRATYTGASASTVLNSVIAPLEEQINGVENMMYMTSTASNTGSGDISIYFKQGTDPDMAAVNVQNRVSMAQGLLPAEVTRVGVTTQKRQTSMLVVFSLYDETDIQMPAINGFDLVKLLRASNIPQAKTIPVIAVTARSEMDKAALHEHGFAGCLHKPFTVKELLMTVNEGQLSADEAHITEDMATAGINFSALTAYSEDDPEAASSIIQTFIEETGKNIERMQQALNDKEVDGIAAMAHKLLPLFTMIGADETITPLKWLEACRGEKFSEKIEETTLNILEAVHKIISEAERYLIVMKNTR